MAAQRFEDLIAWQKARQLTKSVYDVSRKEHFSRNYGFSSQFQRAAVSVMSNIAEGFERNNPREFHQFLVVAKGSCGEVRSHLYVALDNGYLTSGEFDELREQTEEVGRIVNGLRAYIERSSKPK